MADRVLVQYFFLVNGDWELDYETLMEEDELPKLGDVRAYEDSLYVVVAIQEVDGVYHVYLD